MTDDPPTTVVAGFKPAPRGGERRAGLKPAPTGACALPALRPVGPAPESSTPAVFRPRGPRRLGERLERGESQPVLRDGEYCTTQGMSTRPMSRRSSSLSERAAGGCAGV